MSIDTLRAWERRHGAVRPVRDERGRMYTDADVHRLRLLRDAVAGGQSIGRISTFDDEQLRALAGSGTPDSRGSSGAHAASRPIPGIDLDDLLRAVERFDSTHVETELARAAALLAPRELLRNVVGPLLETIGNRWQAGDSTVAHEHLLSATVRNVLGSLLRAHGRRDPPARAVFATPSGEAHELGTLGAAMLAAAGGLGAIYLGPSVPAEDIAGLTETADADVVVLGVTATAVARDEVARSVERIARDLPRDVEIWLGGPAAQQIAAPLRHRLLALSNYDELTDQLIRIGARF